MDLIHQSINRRFTEGSTCPYCKSSEVSKYGFYKGDQRYKCKLCRRTFTKYSKTIINWSHYKNKWSDFIRTMEQDLTLREAGEKLGVSYSTLFYWRHKIMNMLSEDNEDILKGVIEVAKVRLPYVNKNRKGSDYYNDDKLGTDVNLTFFYERNNKLSAFVYKNNTFKSLFIKEILPFIDKNSIICLHNNNSFKIHMKAFNLKLRDCSYKRSKRRFYYNGDNAFKSITGYRKWIRKFKGVSSKYLPKYVAYYKTNKIFNTMEYIILNSLGNFLQLSNNYLSLREVIL